MSDDLRTRIAQTLYGDGEETSWARSVELADLIIWATGLREQSETINDNVLLRRWVTDWTINTVRPPYCQRCGIPHTTQCKRDNP